MSGLIGTNSTVYGVAIGVSLVALGLPCVSWRCDFAVVLMSATVMLLTVSLRRRWASAVGVGGGRRRWASAVGSSALIHRWGAGSSWRDSPPGCGGRRGRVQVQYGVCRVHVRHRGRLE